MLHQIKAQQFSTDFCLNFNRVVLQKTLKFKNISMFFIDSPVLFKAVNIQGLFQEIPPFSVLFKPV